MPVDLLRINVVDYKARPLRAAVIDCGMDDILWRLMEECWSANSSARPNAASVTTRLHHIRSNPTNADKLVITTKQFLALDHAHSNVRNITNRDIIIAVMGPTGSGKSSFINIATGQTSAVIGHDLASCTEDVYAVSCPHPDGGGRNIVFVDTPGFDDTERQDYDILNSIAEWLKQTYQQHIQLTGILFLHRISETRMRGTPLKNLEMFKALCGANALQNVILTTTMWNEVTDEIGCSRENELQTDFWKPLLTQGSRMTRFDLTTYQSAWRIIDMFHIDSRPLQVQTEMVDEKKPLSETSAYAVLVRWWERIIVKFRGENRKPEGQTAAKHNVSGVVEAKEEWCHLDPTELNLAPQQKQRLDMGGGQPKPEVPLPIKVTRQNGPWWRKRHNL